MAAINLSVRRHNKFVRGNSYLYKHLYLDVKLMCSNLNSSRTHTQWCRPPSISRILNLSLTLTAFALRDFQFPPHSLRPASALAAAFLRTNKILKKSIRSTVVNITLRSHVSVRCTC